MGGVIIPKTYVPMVEEPLIFLAGPILGAPNWQDEAVDFLLSQEPSLIVVSLRRKVREKIARRVLKGDETFFPRQRAWERHYLNMASETGTTLFWLPGEVEHDCSKSYGAMTRFELGQVMASYSEGNPVSFCVGSDGKFSELHIIQYDLSLDVPNKEIIGTLEETCLEAIKLLPSRPSFD